jgi:hypothetical protein|tara:strand:- start:501 stop:779 length:279 start_codon:yes stop_codon:yes gene_type:complete
MDKKHAKKVKRSKKKKKDKKQAQEDQQRMSKQLGMFDRLPDSCSACKKEFPQTREAHMSWRVVARYEEKKVRLFCPDCHLKAKQLVGEQNEV